MQSLLLLIIFKLCFISASFAQVYHYKVDLNNVSNDQLTITLNVPNLNQETLQFQFPISIPGTYDIGDYGRFVIQLEAVCKTKSKA